VVNQVSFEIAEFYKTMNRISHLMTRQDKTS